MTTSHLRARPFDPKTKCGLDVSNVTVVHDVAYLTCRTCLKAELAELRERQWKSTVYKPKRKDK